MRRTFFLGLLFASITGPVSAQSETQPNIVIFLADDLGVGDLGCYGQRRIATPHIDALAAEGVLARRAYAAAPVCAPSRCSLLTGMHAGHCSVDHNDEPNLPLGLSDPTIAEVLARAGYRTGIVGKWGLGGESDDGSPFGLASLPTVFGFEHVLVALDQERAQDHFPDRLFDGEGWRAIAGNADGARGVWDADLFADDALAFVDAASTDSRPFFLYFASTLPHRELDPPELGHDESGWPDAERAYATMVERFDADVGRIVARLDALTGRTTVVIVASDNGPVDLEGHAAAFFDSTAGRRGQKRDLYEGGLRVPLVVRWRGSLEARAIETPVVLYDLFPTIGELARTQAPIGVDGVSIAAWLRGERTDAAHATMFFSVSEAHGGSEPRTRFALYEGPLALIEREGDGLELYDVVADPRQANDLASERASDVARLHEARLAESTGPIARALPRLGVDDDGTPAERAFAPVLDLVFEPMGSRVDAPELAITAHGGAPSADVLVLPRDAYVTVGAHPALSMGEASFTLEARVRLDHVGPDAHGRDARRYLALSKPTGNRDELTDWAVLVQTGDLGTTGHELALVFADPDVGGHGTWVVTSVLAITDDAWHAVAIRVDASAHEVTFDLDDRSQTVPFVDMGHVRSDGPLVIGAHHDLHGQFDGWLDGAIGRFRLSRGVVPTDALHGTLTEEVRTLVVDLGTIAAGTGTLTRTIDLANVAMPPALAMDLDLDRSALTDTRLAAEMTYTRSLTPDADAVPLTIRLSASEMGVLADQRLVVHASASHFAFDALGGPLVIEVHGEVTPAPPTPWEPPSWLPYVAAVFVIIGARLVLRAEKKP